MSDDAKTPEIAIAIRVPGPWENPGQLAAELPEGFMLAPEGDKVWLTLPDGARAEVIGRDRDSEFARIWLEGCTRAPTETEVAGVNVCKHIACLLMPGGTMERASAMLRAGAALMEAGGYGAFVDNSGIGHGASDWLDLADDVGPDGGGPFWGFVNTYGDDETLWTHGMHVLGFRDGQMPRTGDDKKDDFTLRNFLAYTYRSGATIRDGDDLGDDLGPTFKVNLVDDTLIPAPHPMHNPFGRYVLRPLPREGRTSSN